MRSIGIGAVLLAGVAAACLTNEQDTEPTTTALGSGSGSCTTPALAVALAPTPLATELRTTNHITAIVSTNGLAGAATIRIDAINAPDWTVSTPQTVAMPSTGTAVVGFDVTIPSDAATLTASIRVRATIGTTTADAFGQITAAKQITIVIPEGSGTTSYHTELGPDLLRIRAGTLLRWYNADTIAHAIHGQGGILHEMIDQGAPGTYFTATVNADGTWYCHTHEYNHPRMVTVVP
jgi:plastocyanin